jgi:hypothetical protein
VSLLYNPFRTMQKFINRATPDVLDQLMELLKDRFAGLLMDTYGNYFCQKLIQTCNAEQRLVLLRDVSINILTQIQVRFFEISCNPCGTHALQSLIEIVNQKQEEDIIVQAVNDSIYKLSMDNNGTHVMQKIISVVKESNRVEINKTLLERFNDLVFDANGICVVLILSKILAKKTNQL